MAQPALAPTFGMLPDILPPPKVNRGLILSPDQKDAQVMRGGPQSSGASGASNLTSGYGSDDTLTGSRGSAAGGLPGRPAIGPTILIPGDEAGRIVSITDIHRERSRRVRWPRLQTNRRNWNAFHLIQDWSTKIDGQSRIFLPDLPISIHQAAAVI